MTDYEAIKQAVIEGDDEVIKSQVALGELEVIDSCGGKLLDKVTQVIAEIANCPACEVGRGEAGLHGVSLQYSI